MLSIWTSVKLCLVGKELNTIQSTTFGKKALENIGGSYKMHLTEQLCK